MNTTSTPTRAGQIKAAPAGALHSKEFGHPAAMRSGQGQGNLGLRPRWFTAMWAALEAWPLSPWPPHAGWPQ